MSRPISDPVFDIGRDLQRAYDEGYKQGRYDEKVETETSLPSGEQTHALRTETHACDLIKRQAAIDAAVEAADEWDGGYSRSREEIITLKLQMLPSAQPERKKGKWVHSTVYTDNRGCEFAKCKCSNCGHEEFAISYNVTHGKYCPNCGSYNRGENYDKG